VIAPLRAGLEGWSVAATVLADARAQITDGRAAPRQILVLGRISTSGVCFVFCIY
jgi:hypothetical protein